MRGIWIDVGLAWQLLTVVPFPFAITDTERPAGYAAPYFPLVGLGLGAVVAGVAGLVRIGGLPEAVGAAVVLTVWAGLTGFLHLDGFMDCCDGLLPPRDTARRLEIMHDSRVGAFGVVGGGLLLLLKFSALQAGPSLAGLLIVPMVGRGAMTVAMWAYPPARGEGLAVFFRRGLGGGRVGLAVALTLGVSGLAVGWWGPGLVALGGLAMAGIARLAVLRLGGLTGDVYGAIGEAVETVVLVALVVLLT